MKKETLQKKQKALGGRFARIVTSNSKGREAFSGKIISVGDTYVNVTKFNPQKNTRIHKNSILAVN